MIRIDPTVGKASRRSTITSTRALVPTNKTWTTLPKSTNGCQNQIVLNRQAANLFTAEVRPMMTGKSLSHSTEMDRRNFLSVLGGTGIASAWYGLPTTDADHGSEPDSQAQTPRISDRFHENNQYNKIVIGRIGSGKTPTTRAQLLRQMSESELNKKQQVVIGDSIGGKSYTTKMNLANRLSETELPENVNP